MKETKTSTENQQALLMNLNTELKALLDEKKALTLDIERATEDLENQLKETRSKVDLINRKISALNHKIQRLEKGRDHFPDGFKFGFDSRRGDPNFPGFWYCILLDADNNEVWRGEYSEESHSEEEALGRALGSAWHLYDIAQALIPSEEKA